MLLTPLGRRFRLETNFDNWEPITDGRRQAATKAMDALGREHADSDGLLQVLSTPPVLATDTTYTATMANRAGEYNTLVRTHDDMAPEARAALTAEKLERVRQEMRAVVEWYRKQPFYGATSPSSRAAAARRA